MSFKVYLLPSAEDDLDRLYDFTIERELERDGDLDIADFTIAAVRTAIETLRNHPFTCRKSGENPLQRELVIAFGSTGYLALFDIVSEDTVLVSAIRHQREDDYH